MLLTPYMVFNNYVQYDANNFWSIPFPPRANQKQAVCPVLGFFYSLKVSAMDQLHPLTFQEWCSNSSFKKRKIIVFFTLIYLIL